MFSELQSQPQHELERNAYNAAFYELGFSWYWDRATYERLMQQATDATDRVRHYLEIHQPHLLRAYDSAFLVSAIEAAKAEQARRGAGAPACASGHVDWGQLSGCQLGV